MRPRELLRAASPKAQWPFRDAMEVRCMEVNLVAQRKAPGAAQELRRRPCEAVCSF